MNPLFIDPVIGSLDRILGKLMGAHAIYPTDPFFLLEFVRRAEKLFSCFIFFHFNFCHLSLCKHVVHGKKVRPAFDGGRTISWQDLALARNFPANVMMFCR